MPPRRLTRPKTDDRWKKSVKNKKYALSKNAKTRLLVEGDSWFGYPFYKNIIDYLDDRNFATKRLEVSGDTLQNMVTRAEFFPLINKENPKCLLFSGGGNDILNSKFLKSVLKVQTGNLSAQQLLDMPLINDALDDLIGKYERIVGMLQAINPNVPMIVHGYDYLRPSDVAVKIFWIKTTGPWLKPELDKNGITDSSVQFEVIKMLIDGFNSRLENLGNTYPNTFKYLDCRNTINADEWDNEIHPKTSGFRKIADKFEAAINSL